MFEFANGLLLALFAAAVFDLAAAWRRTGSVQAAFGWLWRTEHPLFGDWLCYWYENHSKPTLRASTQNNYENVIKEHIF